MNDFRSPIDFVRRVFFLTVFIGMICTIFIFVSVPLLCIIRDLMWKFSEKNIVQKEIRIRNDCLSYLKKWECFLMEERSRFKSWKESIVQPRKKYCAKFVSYLPLRVCSPWDLDMPSIRSALQSHYPDDIALGACDITPWQRAIWESCGSNSCDFQLSEFSKVCFRGTNIDVKLDMLFLKKNGNVH